jgi:hypothetical protein
VVAATFKFLSVTEFEQLGSREKLAYLSDAMAELQRTKLEEAHGWDNLFAQSVTQQQPGPDPKPPEQRAES